MIDPQTEQLVESYDAQAAELQTLQAQRVQDILLVASLYDSYTLSEGEHLSELIFGSDHFLTMVAPPRITRVSTRQRALQLLATRPFDLVITMTQASEMAVSEFGRQVKAQYPGLPVFFLAYNLQDLRREQGDALAIPGVNRSFIWRGDARLFLALIELVEDQLNVEHDSHVGGVRTLILVEDSVSFYSAYLPLLFTEIEKQTEALIADSVNIGQRILLRRLRPKILLATTFEEGLALYEKLQETVLTVISDVRFPRRAVEDPRAGVALLRHIRAQDEDTPLLLQSSQNHYRRAAEALGAGFLNKNSPTLLHDFRAFMLENLGFGDFVFRTPDGLEVGRAADVAGLIQALEAVPAEALLYHGSRNHFSNWLMARTEFRLATALRKLRVSDFETVEEMRAFLIRNLKATREESRRGQVEDFDARRFDASSEFVRIGGGSLGGKGRGLAFMRDLIGRSQLDQHFKDVRIFVPPSAVVGTDVFDAFLEQNGLLEFALHEPADEAILRRFLEAILPAEVVLDLAAFLERVRYPLAVRSSSLLEDSHHVPAAGIYPTHMLPNAAAEPPERLRQLQDAIKHIYAATFFQEAKAYVASTPNRLEEEKMAVVIQQIVGRRHDATVYPDISGVAQSVNFYPIREMQPEEGIASVALGLGKTVVEGDRAVRFSPAHPHWLPQFSTPLDVRTNSQRSFWALDVSKPVDFFDPLQCSNLVQLDLETARRHGTLWPVASVYSPDNDVIYDGLARPGIPLVTMAPLLKDDVFPLAESIRLLLEVGRLGMAGPVEVEFAANLQPPPGEPRELAFLQIRPLVVGAGSSSVDVDRLPPDLLFVHSTQAMGVGRNAEIRDVVAVRMDRFDRAHTMEVAAEIGRLNGKLVALGRPYLLIGPGRWGTADRWLGIPVMWSQISGARTIVECEVDGLRVEPSQGTHFFHNMTSLGIGYFTVQARRGGQVDWAWLDGLTPAEESDWARHYVLPAPLEVLIDGRSGEGVVLKPGPIAPDGGQGEDGENGSAGRAPSRQPPELQPERA